MSESRALERTDRMHQSEVDDAMLLEGRQSGRTAHNGMQPECEKSQGRNR
jgi:hypothetical protein